MTNVLDNHNLHLHPEKVAKWIKKEIVYPLYIEAGFTNSCPQRCIYCGLDFTGYKPIFIKREPMLDAIEDMAKHGVRSIMTAGEGESLLHKNSSEFIQKAKTCGMDVAVTTNGMPLTEEKSEQILPSLSWLRFSISAGVSETYGYVHGINPKFFSKTLKNVGDAVKVKVSRHLSVDIGVQFLLLNENYKEVYLLGQKVRDLGVANFQVKPYSHHPASNNDLKVSYLLYQNLEEELEKLNTKTFKVLFRAGTMQRLEEKGEYKECYGLDFFVLVTSQGFIIPCNMYYGREDEYAYGNINDFSFSQIWESARRQEVKEKINKEGTEHCRSACRLDSVNRYLWRIKNPEKYDNFL
jgi:MoaA/NifB/PqqE/SkfB family radical SAM enzyme